MIRALLAALAAVLLVPAAAHATPCEENVVIGSTDGDFDADLAAGVPSAQTVVLRESATPEPFSISGGPTFGTGLALADMNGDACSDLLAGTPAAGRVDVFAGSASGGLTADIAATLTGPPGEGFGTAIAVSDRGAFGMARDLWIAAPRADVNGKPDAGAIYHYGLLPGDQSPQLLGTVTVDDPTLPGDSKAGIRFGRILSPTSNGVLVGVPNAGPHAQGAVYAVRVDEDGALVAGQRAVGRRREHFGASVAVDPRGHATIVGAPGARVGAARNAGVAVLYPDDALKLHTGKRLRQGAAGVPGLPQRGDHFGASVVIGLALGGCQEATEWAAGAPGDAVGGRRNAGTVTIGQQDTFEGCAPRIVRAGAGLPGAPQKNARLGAGLGLLRYRDDFDEDTFDAFAVTVPGRHEVLRPKLTLPVGGQGPISLAIPESGNAF